MIRFISNAQVIFFSSHLHLFLLSEILFIIEFPIGILSKFTMLDIV